MVEALVHWLQTLSPFGVLLTIFFIAYIENLFPPSPSDILIVFGGTLVGLGTVGFPLMLAVSTLGSVTGFLTMFYIGKYFGDRILEEKKIRFLPLDLIHKAEHWFQRYGYGIIVVNRFLSGTRAIISFFAGMSHLPIMKTTVLCAVSACIWNTLLLYAGMALGARWVIVNEYLSKYGNIVLIVVGIAVVLFGIQWKFFRSSASADKDTTDIT